jgi:hypothetical protein
MCDHAISMDDQEELRQLEHAMWSERTRYDLAFQDAHFAEDFLEFGRSGRVYDRDAAMLRSGPAIVAQLKDMRIRPLSRDHVQVVYDSIVRSAVGETLHAHRSSIWSRQDGGWEMRFHQATPYEPAA